MDRFTAALIAVSLVFFWFPICAIVLVGGMRWLPPFSFGAVLVLLAGVPAAGSILCLYELRMYSRLWYLGAALCGLLLVATAVAVLFLVGQIDITFSITPAGLAAARIGHAALLGIAPCSVLFFIAFLPFTKDRDLILYAIGISAATSLLSLAMIGDSIFVALGLYYNAVYTHPFYEGFLILYGTLGTPWIGIMILAIAFRYRNWTGADPVPPETGPQTPEK
ncbi:MAG: hypothetical protein M0Q92_09110 [Methanoregula sp.]|jgi:hypothetical protein|nr:hypothetical protein [Methanoregula sp.]